MRKDAFSPGLVFETCVLFHKHANSKEHIQVQIYVSVEVLMWWVMYFKTGQSLLPIMKWYSGTMD